VIRITIGTRMRAVVEFPFDAEAVAIIKGLPDRYWNNRARYWTISVDDIDVAGHRFTAAGYQVTVDGQPWAPQAPPVGASPFRYLFDAMPPVLRKDIYRGLARALHPDHGRGDEGLMKELNDVWDDYRQEEQ
jgi:hypothetical protein